MKNYRPFKCIGCRKLTPRRSPLQCYCDACRPYYAKLQLDAYKKRPEVRQRANERQNARRIRSTPIYICEKCGAIGPRHGRQILCPACRKGVEAAREQLRSYRRVTERALAREQQKATVPQEKRFTNPRKEKLVSCVDCNALVADRSGKTKRCRECGNAHERALARELAKTPEYQEKRRRYRQRPDVKARHCAQVIAWQKTERAKTWKRSYVQTPEQAARIQRDYERRRDSGMRMARLRDKEATDKLFMFVAAVTHSIQQAKEA